MLPSKKLINSEDLKRYSLGSKSGFLKKCILMYSMFSTLIEIEEVYEIKEMTICGSPQTHPYNTLQHPGGKKILQVKNPFVPSPAKMPFFSSSSFRTCTPPGPNPCAASLSFPVQEQPHPFEAGGRKKGIQRKTPEKSSMWNHLAWPECCPVAWSLPFKWLNTFSLECVA